MNSVKNYTDAIKKVNEDNGRLIMKKSIISCVIIIGFIFIMVILNNMIVNIKIEDDNMELKYYYADSKISTKVDLLDSRVISEILNGYVLKEVGGVPTCGFTDDIAIYTNDKQNIFCIACDSCPIIYWKNKNIYISISEKEMEELHQILKKYGMIFPCV